MNISVTFSGQLRPLAGIDRESLEIDGPRALRDFAAWLAEKHGEPLKSSLLGDYGLPQRTLLVCVNDEQIGATEHKILCDGDEVAFMSPISGG